jgi:two-component system, LuxR family, sensor kinase FixL
MSLPPDIPTDLEDVLKSIQDGMIDELAESEARFRAVVEAIVDAIIIISERGVIEFGNAAAERMFGWGQQELVGKNVSLLMPAAMAVLHDEYLQNDARTGESRISGSSRELTGQRTDGAEFSIELSVSEVFVNGRRVFAGVLRDVTNRGNVEAQLRVAEQTAIAESRAKSEFLRSMNHHLRTPLTPILGYAELLLEEKLTEHQQELVAGIQRNAQQLLSEVSRVLDAAYQFDHISPVAQSPKGHLADSAR